MTDWSRYRHYRCHVCADVCINKIGKSRTSATECVDCHDLPDLRQASAVTTSERVEGAAPSHGGPTDAPSARPRAERRGHSSARKPGGPPGRLDRGCGSGDAELGTADPDED